MPRRLSLPSRSDAGVRVVRGICGVLAIAVPLGAAFGPHSIYWIAAMAAVFGFALMGQAAFAGDTQPVWSTTASKWLGLLSIALSVVFLWVGLVWRVPA